MILTPFIVEQLLGIGKYFLYLTIPKIRFLMTTLLMKGFMMGMLSESPRMYITLYYTICLLINIIGLGRSDYLLVEIRL